MTIAGRILIIAPGVLWLLLVALMIQDWIADPYNPGLRGTVAYGHNQEGALFHGVLWSIAELAVLYGILRPWSFRASWGRALLACLVFLPWAAVNGMALIHSGGVFFVHALWLFLVALGVLCLTLAYGFRAILLRKDAAA